MNKKIIVQLFLILILNLNAQQNDMQGFSLKAGAWNEPKAVRLDAPILNDFIKKIPKHNSSEPQHIALRTKSGLDISALFFDRGSEIALIAGQGLPASKESMYAYANLFDSYDIILFDYRWNNKYLSSLLKSLLLCSPTKRMLLDEEEEIFAVLDFIQKRKKYEKIVGLGECYSNFLFAKIQSDNVKKIGNGPFTHLILDSCWLSFKLIAESICNDPYLPFDPQEGGAPWIFKKITSCSPIKWFLLKIIFTFMQNVSIEEHISNLDIPVLFIYGLNDLFVSKLHFEDLWKLACKEKRIVLFTPYCHSDNLHNKIIYRFICEQFVNSSLIAKFLENCEGIL